MERLYRDKSGKKMGGGLKNMPQCERCGRPVKISSDDYTRDEILCTMCAVEARTPESGEFELGGTRRFI